MTQRAWNVEVVSAVSDSVVCFVYKTIKGCLIFAN